LGKSSIDCLHPLLVEIASMLVERQELSAKDRAIELQDASRNNDCYRCGSFRKSLRDRRDDHSGAVFVVRVVGDD